MEARDVVPTLSPSMDIQVSSNLERLLFELYGRDPERTARELSGVRADGIAHARRRRARGAARALRGRRASTTTRRSRRCAASTSAAAPCSTRTRAVGLAARARPARRPRRAARRARDRAPRQVPRRRRARHGHLAGAAARARRPARAARALASACAADAAAVAAPRRAPDAQLGGRAGERARRAARRTRRPSAPAGAAGRARANTSSDPNSTPTAQNPAPESMPPALSEATAAQNATRRSFVAVSTPRSRGEVMSAMIVVPATKHPAQPSPSRKKNGVISGDAPVDGRSRTTPARRRRSRSGSCGGGRARSTSMPDGVGEREHADEVRRHQQLHLPVGPAAVAELDRRDRHHAHHRGLGERGRDDRGARRAEAHELAARTRRRRLGDRRERADTSGADPRRRRAGRAAAPRSARARRSPNTGTSRNGPALALDAEHACAPPLGRDREQRPDDGADRAGGRDGADAAPAQRRRIEVGRRGATQQAPGPGRSRRSPCRARTARSSRPRSRGRRRTRRARAGSRPASSTGLRPRFCGDAPDDEQREHAEQERDADARAGEALVARELLRGDRADRRVERQRRAHEDLRAREPPASTRTTSRGTTDRRRSLTRVSMSHAIAGRAARARGTLRVT